MGTSFKIVFYASSDSIANRAFAAAFARIKALDQCLSNYKDDSELTRLCRRSPTTRPIRVSPDLWQVLKASSQWHKKSAGCFDITIGPLTQLWRRARRSRRLPTANRLQDALSRVGGQHLVLHPQSQLVELRKARMQLDLGGIAKGFANDEALRVLKKLGIQRAFVNGGGDLAIAAAPPGKAGWPVRIRGFAKAKKIKQTLVLRGCGIATSGDVYQSVTIGGKKYSHIVDPRTGLGLTKRIAATVVAPDGMTADALASALSIMSLKDGMKLVKSLREVEAQLSVLRGGRIHTIRSANFRAYTKGKE